ncbi:hypothetical protein QQ045_014548 [Rhodiola kirilowii]
MAFYKTSMVILVYLIVSCTLTSSSSVPNHPPPPHSYLIGGGNSTWDPIEPVWCGGWQPIKNVNTPTIQILAKFALAEHNRRHGTRLKFGRVIVGESRVTAGWSYRLILAASSYGKPRIYGAMVHIRPWENIRKLIYFRSV